MFPDYDSKLLCFSVLSVAAELCFLFKSMFLALMFMIADIFMSCSGLFPKISHRNGLRELTGANVAGEQPPSKKS